MTAAEGVSTNKRLYSDNLSGPATARYKDKVEICGFDPYNLKQSDFSEDKMHLPAVTPISPTTSWGTKKQIVISPLLLHLKNFLSDLSDAILAAKKMGRPIKTRKQGL